MWRRLLSWNTSRVSLKKTRKKPPSQIAFAFLASSQARAEWKEIPMPIPGRTQFGFNMNQRRAEKSRWRTHRDFRIRLRYLSTTLVANRVCSEDVFRVLRNNSLNLFLIIERGGDELLIGDNDHALRRVTRF